MVTADNVGSFQMQQVRMALRGEAVVCYGKNTMMRRVLKNFLEQKEYQIEVQNDGKGWITLI